MLGYIKKTWRRLDYLIMKNIIIALITNIIVTDSFQRHYEVVEIFCQKWF